jgi:hypothetical protein
MSYKIAFTYMLVVNNSLPTSPGQVTFGEGWQLLEVTSPDVLLKATKDKPSA